MDNTHWYRRNAISKTNIAQNESYWIVRVDSSHHWYVEHCGLLHVMLIGVAWTCLPQVITLELDKTGPIQHNGRTSCM